MGSTMPTMLLLNIYIKEKEMVKYKKYKYLTIMCTHCQTYSSNLKGTRRFKENLC